MKQLSLLLLAGCLAMPLTSSLRADPVKKATTVTFAGPVEIPGMVLQPGTYVMKVPDPVTHRDMVGFYNQNESHLYKLVRTVPAYRTRPQLTDKTVLTFTERASGAPPAVNTWFYPDDYWGRQFVYTSVPVNIAEATPPPPAITEAPAPPPAVAETEPEAAAPAPAPEQSEVAQAAPPPPPAAEEQPAPQPAPPEELPKTGSDLPLLFGAGGLLALAGLALRVKA